MDTSLGKEKYPMEKAGDDISQSPKMTLSICEEKHLEASSKELAVKTHQKETDVEAQSPQEYNEPKTPAAVKVPRSQRRGLFGRFTILAEVEEPKHYPRRTKWFITFVVAMAAMAAPLGSAIFFRKFFRSILQVNLVTDTSTFVASLGQVSEDLHTTPTITNLSVAMYMLSMSIFPLWWSSFSETLGRRTIYIVSFTLFLLWNILSALSKNIAMLVIMRILGGGAAASVQAVGAGTIADIWEVRERGRAMGIFYLGPLMGPLLAPIMGGSYPKIVSTVQSLTIIAGALAEKWGWRSTQWFLSIYGLVILVFLFFALPETLQMRKSVKEEAEQEVVQSNQRPGLTRVTSAQIARQKSKKWGKILKRIFLDPLSIILYLRFPAVLITVYYASITFGSLYVLNISLQSTFAKPPYNFSTIEVGLTYIPNSIGYVLASLVGGRWTDSIMAREARKAKRYDENGKLVYRPEDRMRENAWIAAFIYPAGLIWYGWTAEKGVFWIVPVGHLSPHSNGRFG